MTADAWTIQRVLTWSADFLKGRGLTESPRLDAELLLAMSLGMSRIQLYTSFDKPLTAAEREPFKEALRRRAEGEPVAYITGSKEFMGLSFQVTGAVLIPRPDTESLVETVLSAAGGAEGLRVLDVGTGSGCIAIALQKKLNGASVCAWDIDGEALAIAAANAQRLSADVAFSVVDALAEAAWDEEAGSFDFIVANPPYVRPDEAVGLKRSVVNFEPHRALFAAPDGLTFYRALAQWAPRRLKPGGQLVVEIGSEQGPAVSALLEAAGWGPVRVHKDYGRLDRVVVASWPKAAEVSA